MSLDRGLKRITWVISLVGPVVAVLMFLWAKSGGLSCSVLGADYYVVLSPASLLAAGCVWFLVVWGIYFLVRWIVWSTTITFPWR